MFRQFWIIFTTFVVIAALVNGWLVFGDGRVDSMTAVHSVFVLPYLFPLGYDLVRPLNLTSDLPNLYLLLMQICLTTLFLTTLLRTYGGQRLRGKVLAADFLRQFLRILVWALIWAVLLPVTWFSLAHASSMFALPVKVLSNVALILYGYGLFAVCSEPDQSLFKALRHAMVVVWKKPAVAFGLLTALGIVHGIFEALAPALHGVFLFAALTFYSAVVLWLWHMSLARYILWRDFRQKGGKPVFAVSQ